MDHPLDLFFFLVMVLLLVCPFQIRSESTSVLLTELAQTVSLALAARRGNRAGIETRKRFAACSHQSSRPPWQQYLDSMQLVRPGEVVTL